MEEPPPMLANRLAQNTDGHPTPITDQLVVERVTAWYSQQV